MCKLSKGNHATCTRGFIKHDVTRAHVAFHPSIRTELDDLNDNLMIGWRRNCSVSFRAALSRGIPLIVYCVKIIQEPTTDCRFFWIFYNHWSVIIQTFNLLSQVLSGITFYYLSCLNFRYIEIFRSNIGELLQIACRQNLSLSFSKIIGFTHTKCVSPFIRDQSVKDCFDKYSHHKDCVRLRGLPYSATVDDVLDFFGTLADDILPRGIHFVYNQRCQPTGECYVQMNSYDSAQIVAHYLHRKFLNNRFDNVQCIFLLCIFICYGYIRDWCRIRKFASTVIS